MAQKPETNFRTHTVKPFLRELKNSVFFPIQQVAIVGDPDFWGVCNGTSVGLEIKTDEGKLSALQAHKLSEIKRCGGVPIVAAPKNWEAVKKLLRQLDAGE